MQNKLEEMKLRLTLVNLRVAAIFELWSEKGDWGRVSNSSWVRDVMGMGLHYGVSTAPHFAPWAKVSIITENGSKKSLPATLNQAWTTL